MLIEIQVTQSPKDKKYVAWGKNHPAIQGYGSTPEEATRDLLEVEKLLREGNTSPATKKILNSPELPL